MVVQAEQDRVKHLLTEALPMLCKSGLSFSSEFCIEALIGITLDKNDVFLVSIKETVTCDGYDESQQQKLVEVNVTKKPHDDVGRNESNAQKKSHRKRRRSKTSEVSSAESDSDANDIEGPGQVKREKMSAMEPDLGNENDFCSLNTDDDHAQYENDSTEPVIVKQEPSTADFSNLKFDGEHGFEMSAYSQETANDLLHPLVSNPIHAKHTQILPGTSYGQPVQLIPNDSAQDSTSQSPCVQSSTEIKSEPYSDQALTTASPMVTFTHNSEPVRLNTQQLDFGRNILLDLIDTHSLERKIADNTKHSQVVNNVFSNQDPSGTSENRAASSLDLSKCSLQVTPSDWMCLICQQHFTRSYTLQTHIRVVHWKERPYQCSNCPAKFGKKSNMTAHEKLCKMKKDRLSKKE